ncbi:type VI secretion system protein TssA [Marinimicrobium sp. ARAG 43.8]|uniref:type VI secretion system protein TssA n=1 Tax=Marinimicrobium sp. ARAG 43.8 TaxID=3418719 RepID=UPI003CECA5A6
MASPSIIDIESLLLPISDERPSGDDPRANTSVQSIYQTLKRERSSARAAERKSVHDNDSHDANNHWREVLELAPRLLKEEAKDLEVASWYTEALVRKHGFGGLRDAFSLTLGLIDQYWENLYPMPDEDGLETRVSPISGLNGEGAEGVLIAPIRKVPLTEGQHPAPFSYWQYQQALDIQKLADEEARQAKEDKLGYGLNDIEKAVRESEDAFFVNQRDDLDQALTHLRAFGQLLDNHCGLEHSPPTRNIIEILEECRGAINHLGRDKLAATGDTQNVGEPELDSESTTGETLSPHPKCSLDRNEAFRQLREISEFFRNTEPHSPVSYLLEKSVKWGNMRLDELMQELIPDSSSRAHYSELTGVEIAED